MIINYKDPGINGNQNLKKIIGQFSLSYLTATKWAKLNFEVVEVEVFEVKMFKEEMFLLLNQSPLHSMSDKGDRFFCRYEACWLHIQ